MSDQWHHYPPLELASPIIALASGSGGIWAGGYGGVVWYEEDQSWQTLVSGLPLASVTALAYVDGWLLAGGTGGIAYSQDRGQSWQLATVEGEIGVVTAFVASVSFDADTTWVAATLGSGILRSSDAGKSWESALVGSPSSDVSALLWPADDYVLAATDDGIYRSTDAGRAWSICEGGTGVPCAGLAALPDGALVGAYEQGGMIRSDDAGLYWTHWCDLPPETQVTALLASDDSVIVGTVEHGLLRSVDAGATWSMVLPGMTLALASGTKYLWAGNENAVLYSVDHGATWSELPRPPLHDLRRLFVVKGAPLVVGTHVPPVHYDPAVGWRLQETEMLPVLGYAIAPDGAMLLSSPYGLARSSDDGASWQMCIPGTSGAVTYMTFRPDGTGWVGSADGHQLFMTVDHGLTWVPLEWTLGGLSVVALEATSALLMAATYDARRQIAHLWRSDDGVAWTRGAEAHTPWPLVATNADPPALTLGNNLFIERATGEWYHVRLPGSGVRRIVADHGCVLVLTTDGIMRSNDLGVNWFNDDARVPVSQIMDIAVDGNKMYVLLAGGKVWSRGL